MRRVEDSRGRGGKRESLKRYLPLLLALVLIAPSQGASAAVQTLSGSTQQLGNDEAHGTTSYVIDYTYPSTAPVGTNLTLSFTLHVGQFNGLIEYITAYELQVELFVGAEQQEVTLYGPAGFNSSSFLYPGGIWGPINATFPLTEATTGLAIGQSTNATFSVTLLDTDEIGYPYLTYITEPPMTGEGGTLLVENAVATSTSSGSGGSTSGQSGGQTLLPYALLASGAVLMVAAVFLPRGPKPPVKK
jgi:hypothetical protein